LGVLSPKAAFRALLACREESLPECRRLRLIDREEAEAEVAAARRLLDAQTKRADQLSRLLGESVMADPASVPWYESPAFVAPVSIIAGAVAAALVVWLVGGL
jgi:hypothetical protein